MAHNTRENIMADRGYPLVNPAAPTFSAHTREFFAAAAFEKAFELEKELRGGREYMSIELFAENVAQIAFTFADAMIARSNQ